MFTGQAIINLILTYRYVILFPLACIEGPLLALVVGFLIHGGYFSILPAYLLMCSGDFFPDIFYYYLGRFGKQKNLLEKYGSKSQFVTNNFPFIEKMWHEHGFKTMFLSKLAYGLSTPLLISSGLTKMSLKRFISYAFPITLFQYGVILTLGYYLGSSYELATKYIQSAGLIVAAALIIFIIIYVAIQRYARRQIEKLEKEEEKK
jgi:membrane protein DedA with SNARE-associated domain